MSFSLMALSLIKASSFGLWLYAVLYLPVDLAAELSANQSIEFHRQMATTWWVLLLVVAVSIKYGAWAVFTW